MENDIEMIDKGELQRSFDEFQMINKKITGLDFRKMSANKISMQILAVVMTFSSIGLFVTGANSVRNSFAEYALLAQ